jgi:tetratricopeptide (TPR) repeat protein
MAVLNARRLGLELPIWRPITIALVAYSLDIMFAFLGIGSYLMSVALFTGAAWLIWHFDLKPQVQAYGSRATASPDNWHWFLPLVAGGPLSLLVFLAFIVAPMVPAIPGYVYINNEGVEKLDREDWEGAIESFNRAIQLNPEFAVAHFNRGYVLWEMGDFAAAQDAFDKSLSLKPNHVDALFYRGMTQNELAEFDAAIRDFTAVIQQMPDSAIAFNGRGVAYYRTMEYNRALSDFNEALRLSPDTQMASDNKLAAEKALSEISSSTSSSPKEFSSVPLVNSQGFKDWKHTSQFRSSENRSRIPTAAYFFGARGLYHLLVTGGLGKKLFVALIAIWAGCLAFSKKLFGKQI